MKAIYRGIELEASADEFRVFFGMDDYPVPAEHQQQPKQKPQMAVDRDAAMQQKKPKKIRVSRKSSKRRAEIIALAKSLYSSGRASKWGIALKKAHAEIQ